MFLGSVNGHHKRSKMHISKTPDPRSSVEIANSLNPNLILLILNEELHANAHLSSVC